LLLSLIAQCRGDLRVLLLSTCCHAAIGEFGKYGMMFAGYHLNIFEEYFLMKICDF
jgi:hypothetical protein